MRVFRLARKKYAIALSGKGASMSGNRWNSKGTSIIYCAESRALAVAEIVVHLSIGTMPRDFVMLEIDIPSTVSVRTLRATTLTLGWNEFPHRTGTQRIGDDHIRKGDHCILKVPSAVVPGDHNLLINPTHPDFKKIKIVNQTDFPLDERLMK